MHRVGDTARGAPCSTPYLTLLRGGLALRRRSRAHPGGLLPRPFTITVSSRKRLSRFSVALSVAWLSPCPPPLTSGSSTLWSPDFPQPFGRDRSHTRRTRRNQIVCYLYSMRPHIVQATRCIGLPSAANFALASTSWETLGGCTRWQPSHTPSAVRGTITGQRFVRRRS